jgi:membrane protein required for beta-lactamase induction
MWMRLLYFMRSIEQFSYFIRMLMQVVWKIKVFLIILIIAVFGFADTFYSLSTSTAYMDLYVNADGEEVARPSYITSYINSLQYSY